MPLTTKALIDWYMARLAQGGYWSIGLLMAMESSIVPLPSEVVIPPAAHLAHTGQLSIGLAGIVLAGTIGSWVGATLMYWAARLAGRPLVMQYGRYCLIPPRKVEGAERWAAHYGAMGIFISRLVPVVRHLIGFPAGIVRMDYRVFSLFTVVGSALWCSVLCYVGVKMGQDEKLMHGEVRHLSAWLGGAMLVLGSIYYFFVHRHWKAAPPVPVPPAS
jgi:membrane protein DedA with SNARE-associated domain